MGADPDELVHRAHATKGNIVADHRVTGQTDIIGRRHEYCCQPRSHARRADAMISTLSPTLVVIFPAAVPGLIVTFSRIRSCRQSSAYSARPRTSNPAADGRWTKKAVPPIVVARERHVRQARPRRPEPRRRRPTIRNPNVGAKLRASADDRGGMNLHVSHGHSSGTIMAPTSASAIARR